jgi:hypothetical protein
MGMRNRQITLVDLGLDDSFDASMSFVQGIIRNINAGRWDPIADVSFVRTREFRAILESVLGKADVLHIMAHGDRSEGPSFCSSDGRTEFSLELLSVYAAETGDGIQAHTVIADACTTGTGQWQRTVRDSLEHDICYIGTHRMITWHDSTVFCSAFYGALLRNKGRGLAPLDQAMEASARATSAFAQITDTPCPFESVVLSPSRKAKQLVVG